MKYFIRSLRYMLMTVALIALVAGCQKPGSVRTQSLLIKVESEIPVEIEIYHAKDCTNNINFCQWQ